MLLIHPVRLGASLFVFLAPLSVHAATYYVAPTGSDNAAGAGSMATPFATVGRAQTAAVAGDTVFIRGGTYAFTGSGAVGVSFTKSGTAALPINYFAFAGELPVFDLRNLTPSNRVTGLDVHCNFVHIRGLEVKGVHQFAAGQDSWGVRIQGNNNILENIHSHNNDAPGFFITSGANNLILNCDSNNNYDFLEGGGSGDGFGCHSSGGNNVLSGCRAYDNSDDGYDFINAAGTCTVEKSFSFRNGWQPGTTTAAGNGAGFKAGGYGSPPAVPATGAAMHTVRQCVSFGNRSQGFYANHHPGRINFFNNTAMRNPVNFNMLADAGFPSDHVIRNNIAFTGTAISNLTGGTATFNSWNLAVTVSAADFASVAEAEAVTPRGADGSLPNINFMHLVAGSDLIDKGTDVGLTPIVGAAPDLGAFEFGAPVTGSGGGTGVAGATGAGGTIGVAGTTGVAGTVGVAGSTAAGGTTNGSGGAPSAGGAINGSGGGVIGTSGSTAVGSGGAGPGSGAGPNGGGSPGASAGGSGIANASGSQDPVSGGCGCRVTAGGPANLGGPALFLALVAAAGLRKRKQRRA